MRSNSAGPSNLFALLCLIGSVWTVVATSSGTGRLYGSYRAKSDCVTPVADLNISVSDSSITSPASYSFTDLGFPNATLTIGSPNSGTFNGANRICDLVFRTEFGFTDSYLYSCSDEGQFACNIYLDSGTD